MPGTGKATDKRRDCTMTEASPVRYDFGTYLSLTFSSVLIISSVYISFSLLSSLLQLFSQPLSALSALPHPLYSTFLVGLPKDLSHAVFLSILSTLVSSVASFVCNDVCSLNSVRPRVAARRARNTCMSWLCRVVVGVGNTEAPRRENPVGVGVHCRNRMHAMSR